MKVTVIVEFSLIPLGEETSVSALLAKGLGEFDKRGVKYTITPMGTIFEAEDAKSALELIGEAHEALFQAGLKRGITSIKIDDRRDLQRSMDDKVESLKTAIGRE